MYQLSCKCIKYYNTGMLFFLPNYVIKMAFYLLKFVNQINFTVTDMNVLYPHTSFWGDVHKYREKNL